MGGFSEVLETSEDGRFRVLLELDEYADEPYDEGQCPLLRIDPGTYRTKHVMATGRPLDDDDRVEGAIHYWRTAPPDSDWHRFERYLRAFFGTTQIVTWYSGSYWYIAYDTAAWRAYAGWNDDCPMPAEAVNLDEYRAWCEGEVYGWAVERNVTWRREDDPDESMTTWETVDSCGGFYGDDYARQCAMEAYRYVIEKARSDADRLAAAVADIEATAARTCRNPECSRDYPHDKHEATP